MDTPVDEDEYIDFFNDPDSYFGAIDDGNAEQ